MKEKNEMKEEKGNDVDARTFTISKCPANIYEEFVDFAKRETGNNYAMAIKLLMEREKMIGEIKQLRSELGKSRKAPLEVIK